MSIANLLTDNSLDLYCGSLDCPTMVCNGIDTTSGLSLDSTSTTVASNLSTVGAPGVDLTVASTAGSVNVSSGEAAADAVKLNASNAAGGITLTSGTGGILLGGTGHVALTSIATQTLAGNDETIDTSKTISKIAAAAARTGIILEAGQVDGQMFVMIKTDAAANSITFNTTTATSNVAGSNVVGQDALTAIGSYIFFWNATDSLWYPVGTAAFS